jgi:formamidopyrimidine-DNA glycosylase
MPEGPEVRCIADIICAAYKGALISAEHSSDKTHKWARKGVPGWQLLGDKKWLITSISTKGKLIRVDFEEITKISNLGIESRGKRLSMLNTLGMTGSWQWDIGDPDHPDHGRLGKHKRVWFNIDRNPPLVGNGRGDLSQLCYCDPRNFGTIRFMTTEDANTKMNKVGWDLLKVPMITEDWEKLQEHKSIADKEIGAILMKQNHFSGIGNIYKAEILYQLGINPKTLVKNLDPAIWKLVNGTAHTILSSAYRAKGSSVSTYGGGSFQKSLKIYKRKICPKGHNTTSFKQNKRTTWYCPVCQV